MESKQSFLTYQQENQGLLSTSVRLAIESLQLAEGKNNVRVLNIALGLVKTNIHTNMGISFEEYCRNLGNPTFLLPEELGDFRNTSAFGI